MQSKQEGNCYKLHAAHFHGSVDFKNNRQTIKLMSWLDRRDIGCSQEVREKEEVATARYMIMIKMDKCNSLGKHLTRDSYRGFDLELSKVGIVR